MGAGKAFSEIRAGQRVDNERGSLLSDGAKGEGREALSLFGDRHCRHLSAGSIARSKHFDG
jgi:hypothetical protein